MFSEDKTPTSIQYTRACTSTSSQLSPTEHSTAQHHPACCQSFFDGGHAQENPLALLRERDRKKKKMQSCKRQTARAASQKFSDVFKYNDQHKLHWSRPQSSSNSMDCRTRILHGRERRELSRILSVRVIPTGGTEQFNSHKRKKRFKYPTWWWLQQRKLDLESLGKYVMCSTWWQGALQYSTQCHIYPFQLEITIFYLSLHIFIPSNIMLPYVSL